ncbi:MAG TPA: type III PLP-dependent enzyme [Mycobacteriales bacterium]|nr:type III PLP-dependent enzyme [Mycobacteriales bacterium]
MNRAGLLHAAQGCGTPLYVYDLAEVRARTAELLAALPASSRLLYALKANPLQPLVSEARAAGCGAEVSSLGELDVAIAAGFDPAEVLYTGPGKSELEVAAAVERGVTLFAAESPVELARLDRVAAERGRPLRVLLRLQPTGRPASGLSMADGRQFGFEPAEAARAWRAVPGALAVDGCQVYLGSQLDSVDRLLAGFAHATQVVDEVSKAAGVMPRVVDLGGGFPWPYAVRANGCALAELRSGLTALLAGSAAGAAEEVWFETGRRITASAGHLLTTVVDVKERSGGVVIVVDAGINVLGGMAGLGRVLRPNATFDNLCADGGREPVTVDVVGPLCTPLDRLAVRAEVAAPRVGDVLSVPNVGAYGLTASLTAFLSRPAPAELVVDGDELVGSWRLTTTAFQEPIRYAQVDTGEQWGVTPPAR